MRVAPLTLSKKISGEKLPGTGHQSRLSSYIVCVLAASDGDNTCARGALNLYTGGALAHSCRLSPSDGRGEQRLMRAAAWPIMKLRQYRRRPSNG